MEYNRKLLSPTPDSFSTSSSSTSPFPPHYSFPIILLSHPDPPPPSPLSFWRGNSSGDRRSRNPFFSLNAKWLCSIIFSQKLTIFPLQPVKMQTLRAATEAKGGVDFTSAEFELSTLVSVALLQSRLGSRDIHNSRPQCLKCLGPMHMSQKSHHLFCSHVVAMQSSRKT